MGTKKIVGGMCLLCLMGLVLCGCDTLVKDILDPGWQQREVKRQEKIKVVQRQA